MNEFYYAMIELRQANRDMAERERENEEGDCGSYDPQMWEYEENIRKASERFREGFKLAVAEALEQLGFTLPGSKK